MYLPQSETASSPTTGHFEPAGTMPFPEHIGPAIQYVASPTTLTFLHGVEEDGGADVAGAEVTGPVCLEKLWLEGLWLER